MAEDRRDQLVPKSLTGEIGDVGQFKRGSTIQEYHEGWKRMHPLDRNIAGCLTNRVAIALDNIRRDDPELLRSVGATLLYAGEEAFGGRADPKQPPNVLEAVSYFTLAAKAEFGIVKNPTILPNPRHEAVANAAVALLSRSAGIDTPHLGRVLGEGLGFLEQELIDYATGRRIIPEKLGVFGESQVKRIMAGVKTAMEDNCGMKLDILPPPTPTELE